MLSTGTAIWAWLKGLKIWGIVAAVAGAVITAGVFLFQVYRSGARDKELDDRKKIDEMRKDRDKDEADARRTPADDLRDRLRRDRDN